VVIGTAAIPVVVFIGNMDTARASTCTSAAIAMVIAMVTATVVATAGTATAKLIS
jgi:hypothetical protein